MLFQGGKGLSGNGSIKIKLTGVLVVGAVFLSVAALFTPWYQHGIEWYAPGLQITFYVLILFGFKDVTYIQHEDGVETRSYTTPYGWNDYPETGDLMDVQHMYSIAALLTIIAFLGTLLLVRNRKKVLLAVGVVAIAACCVSAMHFFVNIGDATSAYLPDGFWGSVETVDSSRHWGPSLGWYLTVASAIVMVAAVSILATQRNRV